MSVATGGSEAAAAAGGGGGNRVFFQSPRGGGGSGGSSGSSSREDSVSAAAAVVQVQQRRHQQGKVTVKYDRKELRKRLVLEEWIVEQLGQLYGCEVRGRGRGVPGAVAVAAVPSPAAASLAPGILLLPRVAFRRWAEERCHRHLQMTFPVRRPHPAAAPRLGGAPAQGMVKGAPCPIERVSPVPSRSEWEGTALWGRAVAAARPGTEGSLSSGGGPAAAARPGVPGGSPAAVLAGSRCPRSLPGQSGPGLGGAFHGLGGRRSPLDASWPSAGSPAERCAGRRASRRRERDLRGGCAEAAVVGERLRCGYGPLWIVPLRYPDLQQRGRYWPGNLSEQFGHH